MLVEKRMCNLGSEIASSQFSNDKSFFFGGGSASECFIAKVFSLSEWITTF